MNNNQQQASNSIATHAVGTFAGIMLALIVFFIVLPLGSCMMCMVCASVSAGTNSINHPHLSRSRGEKCSVSSECEGALGCLDGECR